MDAERVGKHPLVRDDTPGDDVQHRSDDVPADDADQLLITGTGEGCVTEAAASTRTAAARWYRGRWLHLALGLLVAVLAIIWAGQRAHRGVLDNLDTRLRDAGAGSMRR